MTAPSVKELKSLATSRRGFLKGGATLAGAALVVGLTAKGKLAAAGQASELVANPFVAVQADGKVIVQLKHFEMGQGTTTGLTTLVAEELDADWDLVETAFAPANDKIYGNLFFGAQGTGGSTAIANSFMQYRQAGAAARQLLIQAAADSWGVPAAEITTTKGRLMHPSGKQAGYGEMVAAAAELPALEGEVPVKAAADFALIGKEDLPRKDSSAKTDGSAVFAMDVRLPDMVFAVVKRSPKFGGQVKSYNDSQTLKVKGVLETAQIPRGIVVYARSSWAALKGREALEVEWDNSAAETRSSDAMIEEYRQALSEPGIPARQDGDASAALQAADKTLSAEFVFPFLAHAPMEPLNATLQFDGQKAVLWDGCQFPTLVKPTVAAVLGIDPEAVTINTTYAGGSFGRRANPTSDYAAEVAMAVAAIGGKWPVKLFWDREDDLAGGYYRPLYVERIEAALDADGKPLAWKQALAGKSILIGTFFEQFLVKDGLDATSVEGASTLPYALPNLQVDVRNMETAVPVLWWRSVGHTHTAFSTEVMMDMLAEAAGEDPVAFRLAALADHPRHAGVLKLAAEKADWDKPLPDGHYRGVAVHESFNSFVAEVVEISLDEEGAVKLERVVCAVDCGLVVNPDVVRAQMEGGIGYALSAALRNEVTLEEGEVLQSNFPDYDPLRLSEMPKVEVYTVASDAPPTGVGEPGVPPLAPALGNAIYAATGKRITRLPFAENGVDFV